MQLSGKNLEDIQNSEIGITIGSFDGVHRGHQFILDEFVEKCKERNLKPVVISFSPHPRIVIKKVDNFLIDSSHKKRLFLKEKFDIELVEVCFDDNLREMSGESFFTELITQFKKVKLLYAGHDFSLGKGKEFSIDDARKMLSEVEVVQGKVFTSNNCLFSSTAIRESLQKGDIQKANFLLGHPFKLTATVMDGRKIGRKIGFPTANLRFSKTQILPQDGVYFVKAIYKAKDYRALVNIGMRPTVSNDNIRVVEVYLFDFDKQIYGQELDVEFYQKIRNEIKFPSINELRNQIIEDKKQCDELYYYGQFGLIGRDIGHSKSPAVYAKLIGNNHLNYSLYDLKNDSDINLKSFFKRTPYLSVTSPYKKNVFQLCDKFVGPQDIGSVNCLKLEDGMIIGTNTDFKAIVDILNKFESEKFSKIYILGSGAMSELLSFVLDSKSLPFEILSRKNQKLAQLPTINASNILIINATSRGFTPILSDTCSGTFWDLNYSQKYANKLSQNKKIKYIDGESLLTLQAKYALSFWNLKTP